MATSQFSIDDIITKRLTVDGKRIRSIELGALVVIDPSYNVGIGTDEPKLRLDISGSNGIRIPVGTTAQQPTTGGTGPTDLSGVLRYNTELNQYEAWALDGWQAFGGSNLQLYTKGTNPSIKLTKEITTYGGNDDGGIIEFSLKNQANSLTYQARISAMDSTNSAGYGSLVFSTSGGGNPLERMTIDHSGNVGIGINAPQTKLHINETGTTQQALRVTVPTNHDDTIAMFERSGTVGLRISGANGWLCMNSSNALSFSANNASGSNTSHMLINTSGNVGIGTDSTGSKLEVNGNIKASALHLTTSAGLRTGGGVGSIILGDLATGTAVGQYSVSAGKNNTSSGNYSVAMGQSNTSTNSYSVAMGESNTSSGNYSVAMGRFNHASAYYSVALGNRAWAGDNIRFAIGISDTASSALADNAVGGNNNKFVIDVNGNVGIGNNIVPSTSYKLEVNGTIKASALHLTSAGLRTGGTGSIILGDLMSGTAGGHYSVSAGESNASGGYYSVAMGKSNTTTGSGHWSVAMGQSNTCEGGNSVAMGKSNTSTGPSSVAMGQENTSTGSSSVAMGIANKSTGSYSVAMGRFNHASVPYSVALGHRAWTGDNIRFAIGISDTSSSALADTGSGNNNKFVIDVNGNVGIGNNIVPSTSYKLDVAGTIRATGNITAPNISTNTDKLAEVSISGTSAALRRFTFNNTIIGNANTDGNWAGLKHKDYTSFNVLCNTAALILEAGTDLYLQISGSSKLIIKATYSYFSNNLGIGGSPSYPLHVKNSGNSISTHAHQGIYNSPGSYMDYGSFNRIGIGATNGYSTNTYIAVKVDYGIWASTFTSSSDRRIKKNIRDVPDDLSLIQLRNLPCVYYEYIDEMKKGDQPTIGFIAQDVKEIMPMAVSIQKDFIPSEMRVLENLSWETITDASGAETFKLTINDLSANQVEDVSGTKYRFFVNNGNEEKQLEIASLENEPKSFIFEEQWQNVFLYGRKVDDFHAIDKDKIFAMAFSATQEIDRIQQQEKLKLEEQTTKLEEQTTKLEEQTTKLTTAEAKITTLEEENTTLKARLDAIEAKLILLLL